MKSYRIDETIPISKQAIEQVTQYLTQHPMTISLRDVSDNKRYKPHEIDLIWEGKDPRRRVRRNTILVKGDRYHNTGNFFFEIMANIVNRTPGCFMLSRADFMFYIFTTVKQLYIMRLPETRTWFKDYQDVFKQKKTSTRVGNTMYETLGAIVPIERVKRDLDVREIDLNPLVME